MNSIIQTRFTDKYFDTEENRKGIDNVFNIFIDHAIEKGVWDETIKAIIVTDDFNNEILKQAEAWNVKTTLSQEKEYKVACKILFNQNIELPEYYIFYPLQNFSIENFPHFEIVLSQILTVSAKRIMPKEFREFECDYEPTTLENYIKFAYFDWGISLYVKNKMKTLLSDESSKVQIIDHNTFLIAFKRKLKTKLYDLNSDRYNDDERYGIFWRNYFVDIHSLFLRIIENTTINKEQQIKEDEPCRILVYNVIKEIEGLTKNCIDGVPIDVTNLKQLIKVFSSHFGVVLEPETKDNFGLKLTKNPKDYFKDEIVEVEPRIVCFLDILGFSELIESYDSDVTSSILQDIKESFDYTINSSLKKEYLSKGEYIKYIEYKTFSDNIVISIPYFDNEGDFLANFNLLAIYIRGFQWMMMSKGYFLRGGISVGSYYSDNNIIFSKGLVNAYQLESKIANGPRIIIDKIIMNKLLNYGKENLIKISIADYVILDWENTAFLNPFNLERTTLQQMSNVINSISQESESPLLESINNITKSFLNLAIDVMENNLTQSGKSPMEKIKEFLLLNLNRFQKDEHVYQKYLWLQEFIKWLEKDETSKLKFRFLRDILIQEKILDSTGTKPS